MFLVRQTLSQFSDSIRCMEFCGVLRSEIELGQAPLHFYGVAQIERTLMFFTKKNQRNVREPDETVRLTSSIEAVIWREKTKEGAFAIRFGLNRVDAQGNIRRTFSPLHLAELAEAVSALSVAIGSSAGTEANLATSLKQLGAKISGVLEDLRSNANGPLTESPSSDRLFA
jgi:hypothetical protein